MKIRKGYMVEWKFSPLHKPRIVQGKNGLTRRDIVDFLSQRMNEPNSVRKIKFNYREFPESYRRKLIKLSKLWVCDFTNDKGKLIEFADAWNEVARLEQGLNPNDAWREWRQENTATREKDSNTGGIPD